MTTQPNGPALWISTELTNAQRVVNQNHLNIGSTLIGSHVANHAIDQLIKAQALHTAWATADAMMNNLTAQGDSESVAFGKTRAAIRDSIVAVRVERSTSPVANYQSILLLEAYQHVLRELDTMVEGV